MGATTIPSAQKPIALPRSCGGKASRRTACESGCNAPPVAPWIRRKMISIGSVGARPHRNEAAVKPTTDSISRRLRPNVAASQPVIGRMIALATRYDVKAQVASSIVTERLPAMCGSDTLTTVVSSTSMKVANITETAMIRGLTTFGVLMALFGIDRRDHGHAGAQPMLWILPGVEHDLHRHPLDHFDEVAGGVLRGQQAEA